MAAHHTWLCSPIQKIGRITGKGFRFHASLARLVLTLLTCSITEFCFAYLNKSTCPNNNFEETHDPLPAPTNRAKELYSKRFSNRQILFTENKGQMMDMNDHAVPYVLFRAEAPNMNVYITEKGLTYVFLKKTKDDVPQIANKRPDVSGLWKSKEPELDMAWINVHLQGGTILPEKITREEKSTEHYNFFSPHCRDGIYDVFRYGKITIKEVYPGIDWVFYNSDRGGMKYDFVLHPGADPTQIKLLYEGDAPPELLNDGSLRIKTTLGTLSEASPFSYQASNKKEVSSSYALTAMNRNQTIIGFNIGKYDKNQPFIIDPQLNWFTFFGGTNWDECMSSTTDSIGNLFLTGYTQSINFPVVNPGNNAYFTGSFGAGGIESDVFLAKFSPNGVLLWATYYSGSEFENSYFISSDAAGNIYVTGLTRSPDFPVQTGGANAYFQQTFGGDHDVFILKFDGNGIRLWATFYGGSQFDSGNGLCIDPAGNLLIVGNSQSSNFPTQNAGGFFQASPNGASDAFILKFDNNGSRVWASFYGGSNMDEAHSVATDPNGNIFVSGETYSNNFPTQSNSTFFQASLSGTSDVFVLKFSSNYNCIWASYYGGSAIELQASMTVDKQGNVIILGYTESVNLPLQNAGTFFQPVFNGGFSDLFFLKFDSNGNRLWATYYGGNGNYDGFGTFDAIETDNCDNLYFCVYTDDAPFAHLVNLVNSAFFDNVAGPPNPMAYEILIGRFSSSGVLHWSSYLNGSGNEQRTVIALDHTHREIYAFGSTIPQFNAPYSASNFPLTDPGGGAYYDNTINPNGLDGYEIIIAKFTIPEIQISSSFTSASNCNVCDGTASITVSLGEAPYTFEWSNGVVQSGLTNLSSTITGLCPGAYSAIVHGACGIPDTVIFNIDSPTGGPSNVLINTTACDSFTAPWGAVYSQTGSYSDTLVATNGCDSIITINLTINPAIRIRQSISSCGAYTGPNGTVYSQSDSLVTTYAGVNGCDSLFILDINILPEANVEINETELFISLGEEVQLNAIGGNTYQWTPTNGLSCTSCASPVAAPQESGEWIVSTTNAAGCYDSDTVRINVDRRCNELFIPDTFTPNGNGPASNEKLCAFSNCVRQFNLIIYNRWGEKVFETSDIKVCWDGRYKAEDAPPGAYGYKAYLEQVNNNKISQTGIITLIR